MRKLFAKRILAMFLAVMMVMSIMPTSVFAVDLDDDSFVSMDTSEAETEEVPLTSEGDDALESPEAEDLPVSAEDAEEIDSIPSTEAEEIAVISEEALDAQAEGDSENNSPEVVPGARTTVHIMANATWSIDVASLFNDVDGDTLTYGAAIDGFPLPMSGSILNFNPDYTGQYTLTFSAADDEGFAEHTMALTISNTNAAPRLLNGVAVEADPINLSIGQSFTLTQLESGLVFEDPEGDTLNYTNYCYERYVGSSSGTGAPKQYFATSLYGSTSIQISEDFAGEYWYVFYATDGQVMSENTWTVHVTVTDNNRNNVSFYVGKDQNYGSNGNRYPLIKLYKTAGFDGNMLDYVAKYYVGSEENVIYNPADYTITGDAANGYYVSDGGTNYALIGYEPVAFSGTTEGTVSGDYNMFCASLESGRYSFRAYGYENGSYSVYLGGQSIPIPTETNVDGTAGGGTDIYLRLHSIYTNSRKTDGNYFGDGDYEVVVNMPGLGGKVHHGTGYQNGSYYCFPFMMYTAGNAALYDIYAIPTDTNTYIFSQSIQNTTAVGSSVYSKSVTIDAAATLNVTVPENATFKLYFQNNNFNTTEVTAEAVTEADASYTFHVSRNSGKYTWRLIDNTGTYVTKAGWLSPITATTSLNLDFSGATTDKSTHSFAGLGTAVSSRDEAEIQVYLTDKGFKNTNGTERIRAYRLWEIIDSDTANIMIEPKFNVQVLSGNASDITVSDGGNAEGNWIDVHPTTTDIVAVTYDAIDVYATDGTHKTHGGLYPATNPERTGVFVISNNASGTADAAIAYNSNGASSSRPANWDYNYDNWFYLSSDTNPTLDFTVTGDPTAVEYAVVTTNNSQQSSLSAFTSLTAVNGTYHASLAPFNDAETNGGTVIIKMTNASGVSYRMVRAAKITATVANVSHPGEAIMPGDQISVRFDGTYRGIYKYSGIFNPTNYILRYTAPACTAADTATEYSTTVAQYKQMDTAVLNATIPANVQFAGNADTAIYNLTNGYTYGSMYSAAQPFSTLYNMTNTGVGTNFNAVTVSFCLNHFPDIPIEVHEKVMYTVELGAVDSATSAAISGITAVITDEAGDQITPDSDGRFLLGYGTYNYVVSKTGYSSLRGSFTLSDADASNVVGGILPITVTMTQQSANAWDGSSLATPTIVSGVYQIGTGAELAWFANAVNTGSTGISAVLTADIDLGGYQWTPIGTTSKKFAGTFDGHGHTIDGLYINYSATNTSSPYKGLFGSVNGSSASAKAQIKNFTLNGEMTLTSTGNVLMAYCGGVAGLVNYTDVQNVHSNVDVTVNRVGGYWRYVGGVIGRANSSTVTDCSYNGMLRCYQYSGGVAGYIDASTTLSQCCNTGTVIGTSTYIGGVVGQSLGTVQTSYNSGSVSGAGTTGGVVGQTTKTVRACYNAGPVNGTGSYVGGVVGYASGATASVSNCFNVGSITASSTTYTGAVIGYMNNASATAAHLYYLNTSYTKGIGTAATTTQSATSMSASNMKKNEFATTMNSGLDPSVFYSVNKSTYPIFTWQIA